MAASAVSGGDGEHPCPVAKTLLTARYAAHSSRSWVHGAGEQTVAPGMAQAVDGQGR